MKKEKKNQTIIPIVKTRHETINGRTTEASKKGKNRNKRMMIDDQSPGSDCSDPLDAPATASHTPPSPPSAADMRFRSLNLSDVSLSRGCRDRHLQGTETGVQARYLLAPASHGSSGGAAVPALSIPGLLWPCCAADFAETPTDDGIGQQSRAVTVVRTRHSCTHPGGVSVSLQL